MNTTTIAQSIPDQYTIMLNNYASIVEKTNQQLGLWTNPYGLMVGLLTILIAIAAIIVSVLLWKNSYDQKLRTEKFFDIQEKDIKERIEVFDSMLKERNEKAKKYEESLNSLIQEYQNKLKNVNKENKEEIGRLEKIIDELNRSKISLNSYQIPEVTSDIMSSVYTKYGLCSPIHVMTCFGCGKKFQYKDKTDAPTVVISFSSNKKVYCPHCGAENFV